MSLDREWLRSQHPSARLQAGVITNFREALAAYLAALRMEESADARNGGEESQYAVNWDEYIGPAERCLAEYETTVGKIEQLLAAEWCNSENETIRHIGQCLRGQDYTSLAI
jgi:hypothetical protein